MPFKGPHRSKRQKAHTATLWERQLSQKSHDMVDVVDPAIHNLDVEERQKMKRGLKKIQRLQYNAKRREKRAWKKLKEVECESQGMIEEVVEERCGNTLMELRKETEDLKGEKESLKKDLAKIKARNRREASRVHHKVQTALKHSRVPDTTPPTVRYVKGKRGIVQDWARNTVITLVNEGVPISKTWSVMKASAAALGVTIVGKWSARTSGRVVREGGFAAGLMIVEYLQKCIGS